MTWLDLAEDTEFGVANLPYGVFSTPGCARRVGVAIGSHVLDLTELELPDPGDFLSASLNAFMRRGRPRWQEVRSRITELLTDERYRTVVEGNLIPFRDVTMHLPFEVADYVDFYSSAYHAANVGRIFRPDSAALPPNWQHLPIGYHGRAGTVVPSGTDVVRPCGQRKPVGGSSPELGPSTRLDIEAEVGFVVGAGSELGTPVPIEDFSEHVFGAVLVNDWSARDIQGWESAPLGPFLGKSFATSVSPWVVPLDALRHARVPPEPHEVEVLPYLTEPEPWGLDMSLRVRCNDTVISDPPFARMSWTAAQQLAHLTVNGAALRTGDLYASGTVSGPETDQRGCLLELTWNGEHPLRLADGSRRTYLEDGDTVTITARVPGANGSTIGFGEVSGTVLPARMPDHDSHT